MSQTVRPEVASFVTLVRAHLSDLTPEEVDELTGGLEADLDERLAETLPGDPPADLGDAAAYAAELRAAAGLPPRGAGGGRRAGAAGPVKRTVHWFWAGVAETRESVSETLGRQPWWPEFRASVVALRPAWWIARAYVAWVILDDLLASDSGPLPDSLGSLVLLLLCVGVSVALGRGLLDAPLRLDSGRWRRRIIKGLNVFAVLALPFALATVGSVRYEYVDTGSGDPGFEGLVLNGEQVRNIYAYDAQGNPIGVVQLYDQNGRPLNVAHQPYTDAFNQQGYTDANGGLVAPFVDDRSRNRWNVFPLPTASYPEPLYGDDGNATATASPAASLPPAPLVAVPPVTSVLGIPGGLGLVPTGAATASATAGPSASASEGGTSSPSASAAPTSDAASAKATPAPSTTKS